jgi:hypothetical protein
MEENPFITFLNKQTEDKRGLLLYLKNFILDFNKEITTTYRYKTLFFDYKGKWMCYLTATQKDGVYLSFLDGRKMVEHPRLVSEGRKMVKIYKVPADENINRKELNMILKNACEIIEMNIRK